MSEVVLSKDQARELEWIGSFIRRMLTGKDAIIVRYALEILGGDQCVAVSLHFADRAIVAIHFPLDKPGYFYRADGTLERYDRAELWQHIALRLAWDCSEV